MPAEGGPWANTRPPNGGGDEEEEESNTGRRRGRNGGRILLLGLSVAVALIHAASCADLAIRVPGDLSQQDGLYRLDYSPPRGLPPANTTFRPQEIAKDVIKFSAGLPGTKYDFFLYYSNASVHDWLTWTASITTSPDPPSNLSVNVRSGKIAQVFWDPPSLGGYSSFKLKVIPLSELGATVRNLVVEENTGPFILRDLTPGASYQIQLYSLYENKESVAYISRNFTTKPNTPGRFIVWFRNETTLLVLWQPPYPAGVYTDYKVSIEPVDAEESVLYVEKEGEPPGPAQAAFNGLVPGRAYNISVQTVSEDQVSPPTTAQYRTVPLRPRNLTHDRASLRSDSFQVRWESPLGLSEFDRYQVSIGVRKQSPVVVGRDDPLVARFGDGLEPGKTYQVAVKTVSGNVASWPAQGNVTTRPLPVRGLTPAPLPSYAPVLSGGTATTAASVSMENAVVWSPDTSSIQDSYKVTYHEVEPFAGDGSSSLVVDVPRFELDSLLPGRNYSVAVRAVSNSVESDDSSTHQATRPASPIIKDLQPIQGGLNISWKSDVTSRQDKYAVVYRRNDSAEEHPASGGPNGWLPQQQLTADSQIVLRDLYPGAGYEVSVYAVSHGLWSEPHLYFQGVYPNPPRNVTILSTNDTSVLLGWLPPRESVYSGYTIRYRKEGSTTWEEAQTGGGGSLIGRSETEGAATGLLPGERYHFRVSSWSHRVESIPEKEDDAKLTAALPPSPVSKLRVILDSSNLTLEWERPPGRVDSATVAWRRETTGGGSEEDADSGSKEIQGDATGAGGEGGVSTNQSRTVLDELRPGELYYLRIYTTAHGVRSRVLEHRARTMPLITSEVSVVSGAHETDTITLRYTPTPSDVSSFDTYRFSLSDPEVASQEKPSDDPDRKVTFHGLTPGRLYNITVWTVSKLVASRPLLRQDRLYPEPVPDVQAAHVGDTSVTLAWDAPRGDYDAFEVQHLSAEGTLVQNLTLERGARVEGLQPHRNYTFTVVVVSGSDYNVQRRSLPVSATFATRESVPGRVVTFTPSEVQPSRITFEWTLPAERQNGILTGFVVTYGLKGSYSTQSREFEAWDRRGTVTNLYPGKTYQFKIQARTAVGTGPPEMIEQRMPIWPPPKPTRQSVPTEAGRSATTIRVRFRKDFFSNQNGAVEAYAIVVMEEAATPPPTTKDLPRWAEVQSYSTWPPYQTNEPYNPFGVGTAGNASVIEDFVVGSEDCRGKSGYCNGPLKPGVTYRVKIRAYTAPDKFTDSYYSGPIQTERNNTGIIVGVTVPVLVLLVLAVVLVMVRLRRVGVCVKKTKEARGGDSLSLPDSIVETSRPVKMKDFADHYRVMSADSDFRFSEEFEELKHVGREQPCAAADLPVNRPKNRFTNILPYDLSRFKLQPTDDEEGSDYINANYVPGHNSPREFVVTQGPLHSTRDDFWRMVWESASRAVVMLTRCVEKGREKCDRYWPYDTQPVFYGDIQVQILNESRYPDWNISEFRVARGDQARIVRHFHFTTWPDFGVPDPPQTLVRFVRAFRERVGIDHKPIVVHCSAGVGRSGTFIALDRLLQHIKKSDSVDIFGMVYGMRKERVWMVQTEQQYICIHQCLLAVLEGKDSDLMAPGGGGVAQNGIGNNAAAAGREIHQNDAFEDDEGIAESGM